MRRTQARREGGASTVELVLYMPVLMIAILLTVQFSLSYLGKQAASAAAREGNRVARVTGDPGAGAAKARAYATDLGRGFLENPVPATCVANAAGSCVPDGEYMRTEVRGNAPRIVPFLPGTNLSEVAQGPIEQFVEDTG